MEFDFDVSARIIGGEVMDIPNPGMFNDSRADRFLHVFGRRAVEQIPDIRACQFNPSFITT